MNTENSNKPFLRIKTSGTTKVSFLAFALIVAFLFALNGRYMKIEDEYYFDKWTKTMLEINRIEVIE